MSCGTTPDTNQYTLYVHHGFRSICFCTGRSHQRPRSSPEKPNLSKNNMEDLNRETRDFSLLGNLICRKFSSNGSNPLIVMGDKSVQTVTRFHAPTQGVRLRY